MKFKTFCASLILCLSIAVTAWSASVTLQWDANTPTPDGYRMYMRESGGSYDYTSPVWPTDGMDHTETTCTLDTLVAGTTYYFVVRAYIGQIESGDSNEVVHTPGANPAIPAPTITNVVITD